MTFTVPTPTLLATPLPALWGPTDGTLFACGDPNNPGSLYWTYPNDVDRTSDTSVLVVTAGSEPLQNGCVYDDRPYVFSTDQLYGIMRDPNTGGWLVQITPCGRGLWTRWASAVGPEGIYFLGKDGIYLSQGGASAVSLTDADLYPIFPHDGVPGVTINTVVPPDMTASTKLRLSYVNGWLYFDYVDTGAAAHTLAFRVADQSWWFDTYGVGVTSRLSEPGPLVYEELMGGANGSAYQPSGATDAGTAIAASFQIVLNQGDARIQKLYRDVMIDGVLSASTATVTLGLSNNAVSLGATSIGGTTGRAQYPVGIVPTTGAFGTNLTAVLAWNAVSALVPQFYLIDVAYQPEVEFTTSWLSGPTTHGLNGYQQVAAFSAAYLATGPVTFSVIVDGVTYTYALPSTGGLYAKQIIWLQSVKGLTFSTGFRSGRRVHVVR